MSELQALRERLIDGRLVERWDVQLSREIAQRGCSASDPGLELSSEPRSGLPFPARLPPRLVLCRSVTLIQLPSQFTRLLLD
jgi:hypothetical protein